MNYVKAIIQYQGTHYFGFQWQDGLATVQGQINSALEKCLEGKVTTVGASRTDTGVHAIEQIVKISYEDNASLDIRKFNSLLPKDIYCLHLEACAGEFKPSAHKKSKEYRYLFTNKKVVTSEEAQFIANIAPTLDFSLVEQCLSLLKGKHDFCNFYSAGSNVKSTEREIIECSISSINPHDFFSPYELFKIPEGITSCYELKILADGFLKQMIRHIVSGLWMVGSGKMTVKEFESLLNSPKSEKQLWKVAPSNGLYLYRTIF